MEVKFKDVTVVLDVEDYVWLKKFSWRLRHINGKPYMFVRGFAMHQLVLVKEIPPEGKLEIDHINRNSLDNRKSNLRWSNRQDNIRNCGPRSGGKSKYKGVSWHKHLGRWWATAFLNGKSVSLGYFEDEKQAALTYDEAVMQVYPESFLNRYIFSELLGLERVEFPVKGTGMAHFKRGPRKGQYKGVVRRDGKFLAVITVEGKQKSLGRYATAEEAALVYDKAALAYFGPEAYQNFPELRDVSA